MAEEKIEPSITPVELNDSEIEQVAGGAREAGSGMATGVVATSPTSPDVTARKAGGGQPDLR